MKHNAITLGLFPLAASILPIRPGDGNDTIEVSYDSAEDIPVGYEKLYAEKDGKYVLAGVKGMKTQADIDRLNSALVKERNDHKAAKTQLSSLSSYGSIEEIVANLDRIPELEASGGKGSEDIEKIVNARLTPLQRKLDEAQKNILEREAIIESYKGKETKATIASEVRKAAKALKVRDSAIEDAIIYGERVLTIDDSGNVVTKDNSGFTPYGSAEDMLRELLPNRSHWLEDSFGGGSGGGSKGKGYSGADPYSHDGWSVTEQMKLMKSDPAKAKKLAERNGVNPMLPTRPAKKG